MNENIILRPFEAKDFQAVIDLLQHISAYRPALDIIEELPHTFVQQTDNYSCVAVRDKRVIAFGSVYIYMRVRGGKSGLIEDMVVASGMRGQGIGGRVLAELLRESRSRGCFKITLEASTVAEKFYQSAGFKNSGKVMKLML
jgi:GNAT superfamily N-acetyltransferase